VASTRTDIKKDINSILKEAEKNMYKNKFFISRIFAVVDAYDAMISDRPFKKAISKDMAIKELKKLSEIQFDPYIVNFFIKVIS